jgi:hypothetical protein
MAVLQKQAHAGGKGAKQRGAATANGCWAAATAGGRRRGAARKKKKEGVQCDLLMQQSDGGVGVLMEQQWAGQGEQRREGQAKEGRAKKTRSHNTHFGWNSIGHRTRRKTHICAVSMVEYADMD